MSPLSFFTRWQCQRKKQEVPDFGSQPGLGADDVKGFPADGELPETLPSLADHWSIAAYVLQNKPDLYEKLKNTQTKHSVGLGRCIKPSVDCLGHQRIRSVGAIAGDEECYEVFRDFLDPVIGQHLGDPILVDEPCDHSTDLGRHGKGLTTTRIDASAKYVVTSQVRVSRNLAGFRFPSAMSFDERGEVERLVARALLSLGGSNRGRYYALRGSSTFAEQPGGMSAEDEMWLQRLGFLFEPPKADSMQLASGAGRDWPHGRGIFISDKGNFTVRVNGDDHVCATMCQKGDGVQLAFRAVVRGFDSVAVLMRKQSKTADDGRKSCWPTVDGYAYNGRLGFLASDPTLSGTALCISIILKLPRLAKQAHLHRRAAAMEQPEDQNLVGGVPRRSGAQPPWCEWCTRQRVRMLRVCNSAGRPVPFMHELTNMDHLGVTEVETVNLVIKVAACIVQMEMRLEAGAGIDDLLACDVAHVAEGTLMHRIAEEDECSSVASSRPNSLPPSPTKARRPVFGLATDDEELSPPSSPLPRQLPLCDNESCKRCRSCGGLLLGRHARAARNLPRIDSDDAPRLASIFGNAKSTASSSVG